MNRSSKGFGLVGVFFAVVVLIVTAVFSTSASASEPELQSLQHRKIN